MKGEITDIYNILKQKYPEIIYTYGNGFTYNEHRCFRSFLGHNTKEDYLTRSTDDSFEFVNMKTKLVHAIKYIAPEKRDTNVEVEDGKHIFNYFPIGNHEETNSKDLEEANAFSLIIDTNQQNNKNRIICLRMNEKGLFIEEYGLGREIKVYYYNAYALDYIVTNYFDLPNGASSFEKLMQFIALFDNNISTITPNGIQNKFALKPDYVIEIESIPRNDEISVAYKEDGDLIDVKYLKNKGLLPFYRDYYDFMVEQELYKPNEYPLRIRITN